jgi:conjugative transfer region protein (TIGR03748 family)
MTSFSVSRVQCRPTVWPCLLAFVLNTSGCGLVNVAEPAHPQSAAPRADKPPQVFQEADRQATRAGRYTLIELGPDEGQRNLMHQIVQTNIPPSAAATVGDALRFLLFRTGYQMCDEQSALELYALPLPAAHLRLGPMTLHQALLTLIGPTWALQIDEASRRICIVPVASPQSRAVRASKADTSPSAPTASRPDEHAQPSEVRP